MDWDSEPSARRRTCMLMVTHACNLNCSYCYETHKKNAYMDVNLAKEIILREAQFVNDSDQFDELQIDFMGGEPLMNFPLIKEIVEWLEGDVISVPWICFATTNATLLTDEIKAWLREHKNSFTLGASYDGTSKMQSTNRGTEKHNMDLAFFREVWSHQPLHMTISKETLPTLAEGVLDIQAKDQKVEASLAQGVNWTIDDALMYREQLCILKDTYLKNTALTPFNRLTRFVNVYDAPATEKTQKKWCGTGKGMATYDIDGKKYGCHMFTPLVLGKDKALPADAVEWDSPESNADDYCKNCVLRFFCPTCPGFNYKYRGHLAVRDKRWCPVVLAEAITACEFQVELLANMDKLDEKDAQYGQAALKAYQVLRHLDIATSQSPYTI
ncbi:MAG: 4Fe-4S cluster-binding domain-containing protein [Selenomonadaceae bacterium]|nr:4Fe-4S cluster-binding domain-containing protein [Selenomonadaceae bacterium]